MASEETYRGPERRKFVRFHVNFRARWAGKLAEREATVAEISMGGCFILSEDIVQVGELLRLDMKLPRGDSLTLWGYVVYRAEEIGFGISFAPFLQHEDRRKLEWLVRAEAHKEKLRAAE